MTPLNDDRTPLVEPEPEVSSKASQYSNFVGRLDFYLAMLLKVVVVTGAVFTFWQYIEARQDRRVERTLELVSLWESDNVQKSYLNIHSQILRLRRRDAEVIQQVSGENQVDAHALNSFIGNALWTHAFENEANNGDLTKSITTMQYFLNRVASCSENRICDPKLTDIFFREYAEDFWSLFGENIVGNSKRPTPLERYIVN